jgi:hypothetical protein
MRVNLQLLQQSTNSTSVCYREEKNQNLNAIDIVDKGEGLKAVSKLWRVPLTRGFCIFWPLLCTIYNKGGGCGIA